LYSISNHEQIARAAIFCSRQVAQAVCLRTQTNSLRYKTDSLLWYKIGSCQTASDI